MNKIYIHLNGIIGTPQEGDDPNNFVQLQDITAQWERARKENPEATDLMVLIKSPGGNIAEGDRIFDFFKGLKSQVKITTKSDGMVGSMATKIFLIGDNRVITEGDEFFIHNPQGAPDKGDSNYIEAYLVEMKKVEKEMVDFYTLGTGSDKGAIRLLMDKETFLTSDQVMDMGFATEKMEKVKAEPVMILDIQKNKQTPNDKNPNTMTKIKEQLTGLFADFKKELKAELGIDNKTDEQKAKEARLENLKKHFENKTDAELEAMMDLKTADGEVITLDADNEEGIVGSVASMMIEGEMAAATSGDHKLDDGRTLSVGDGGKVTAISEKKEEEEESEALKALKIENEKLVNELKEAKADKGVNAEKVEAIIEEKAKPIIEKAEKDANELAALKSHYKVPENKSFIRDSSKPSLKERMTATREGYVPQKTTADKVRDSLGK